MTFSNVVAFWSSTQSCCF